MYNTTFRKWQKLEIKNNNNYLLPCVKYRVQIFLTHEITWIFADLE